ESPHACRGRTRVAHPSRAVACFADRIIVFVRRAIMCLTGSVGANGQNNRNDVKTVQILLNMHRDALGLAAPLAEDGSIGPDTLAGIEASQGSVVGMAHPARRIDPGGSTLAGLRAGHAPGLNAAKLKGIMVNATDGNIDKYAAALFAQMPARDISTPLRQAHF